MSRPSLIIVLAEDQRQKQLLYRYLRIAGIRPDQLRFHISPSGRGSAEQWVRRNFVVQVRKCRTRHAQTGMFVMLDADTKSVQQCLETLDEALESTGQKPVDRHQDPVARLIPKRNVETWILVLSQRGATPPVDENFDYKRTKTSEEWTDLVPAATATLADWTKRSAMLPANLIDSLRQGIEEIPRALAAQQ